MSLSIAKKTIEIAIKKRLNAIPETLEQYLSTLKGKQILLYGAGGLGRAMLAFFEKYNIEVVAFLDKAAGSEQFKRINIPVYLPNHANFSALYKKNVIVILSIVLTPDTRRDIISYLNQLGYQCVIDALTIQAKAITYDGNIIELDREGLVSNTDNMLSVLDILGDKHSRDIYVSNLSAHLERSYHNPVESIQTMQYISSDTPPGKGFSRFIDCGAYTGDTLEKLIEYYDIEAYAGFEPGLDSFIRLSETVNRLSISALCCLFPCAVGIDAHKANFNDVPGCGAIDSKGNCFVQVVRLDDVLRNFNPTMIKMDIEGEEFNALCGAKDMITQYRPDLTICVYHRISDYWRIPSLIHSWALGYEFYLRAHSSATLETVMYAIAK